MRAPQRNFALARSSHCGVIDEGTRSTRERRFHSPEMAVADFFSGFGLPRGLLASAYPDGPPRSLYNTWKQTA